MCDGRNRLDKPWPIDAFSMELAPSYCYFGRVWEAIQKEIKVKSIVKQNENPMQIQRVENESIEVRESVC
jgi:hypothetical protein